MHDDASSFRLNELVRMVLKLWKQLDSSRPKRCPSLPYCRALPEWGVGILGFASNMDQIINPIWIRIFLNVIFMKSNYWIFSTFFYKANFNLLSTLYPKIISSIKTFIFLDCNFRINCFEHIITRQKKSSDNFFLC